MTLRLSLADKYAQSRDLSGLGVNRQNDSYIRSRLPSLRLPQKHYSTPLRTRAPSRPHTIFPGSFGSSVANELDHKPLPESNYTSSTRRRSPLRMYRALERLTPKVSRTLDSYKVLKPLRSGPVRWLWSAMRRIYDNDFGVLKQSVQDVVKPAQSQPTTDARLPYPQEPHKCRFDEVEFTIRENKRHQEIESLERELSSLKAKLSAYTADRETEKALYKQSVDLLRHQVANELQDMNDKVHEVQRTLRAKDPTAVQEVCAKQYEAVASQQLALKRSVEQMEIRMAQHEADSAEANAALARSLRELERALARVEETQEPVPAKPPTDLELAEQLLHKHRSAVTKFYTSSLSQGDSTTSGAGQPLTVWYESILESIAELKPVTIPASYSNIAERLEKYLSEFDLNNPDHSVDGLYNIVETLSQFKNAVKQRDAELEAKCAELDRRLETMGHKLSTSDIMNDLREKTEYLVQRRDLARFSARLAAFGEEAERLKQLVRSRDQRRT